MHVLLHAVVFLARKVVAIGPPALVATAAADALLLVLYLARRIKWDSFRQTVVVVTLAYVCDVARGRLLRDARDDRPSWPSTRWWPILPITGGAVVLICILSSLLSIRRVIVLEPAVVFRG